MNQEERKSGILLHPTSLPGKYGIGTLGKEAYRFVDFLIRTGQRLWQVCPLNPTGYGDSPYQSFSAFAGNPLLIDLELLVEKGYLGISDIEPPRKFDDTRVEFGEVISWKFPLLQKAYRNFSRSNPGMERVRFFRFVNQNRDWLPDYALFMSLKGRFGGKPWLEWEEEIRLRDPKVLVRCREELSEQIEYYEYLQYEFFQQWKALKSYANRNYIEIIGDLPLYVALDSCDAWANPDFFQLDENRNPIKVAGVPPDYFSATGQLWGNPVYQWKKMEEDGFSWWIRRLKTNLEVADIVRFDHFRGLAAYWALPYGEETAVNGEWIEAPGRALLRRLTEVLGNIPMIAEDLGMITEDVIALREEFQLPGMKILQFAFDSAESSSRSFLPHRYTKNCVVYTGTHDNDTVIGWCSQAEPADRQFAGEYLGISGKDPLHRAFVRGAWASAAMFAVAPLQDLLGLGSESRMNFPGTMGGNWQWRYLPEQLTQEMELWLQKLTETYER